MVEEVETDKVKRNKSCKTDLEGYKIFTREDLVLGERLKKLRKVRCSAAGHGDGVGVNVKVFNQAGFGHS